MIHGRRLSETIPGFCPTGALRATKSAPGLLITSHNQKSTQVFCEPSLTRIWNYHLYSVSNSLMIFPEPGMRDLTHFMK